MISDVELNPSLLESSGIHVISTVLKKLEIQLTLEEEGASNSSLAWRAFRLTGANKGGNKPAVSLIAKVWIDGLEIRLQASPFKQREAFRDDNRDSSLSSQSTTQAFLSSYVEAALSSLRLSVKMTNTRIRVDHEENWVEACIKQVLYEDRVFDETAVFHKHLVVANVSAATGSSIDSSQPLLLLEGSADVRWRLLGETPELECGNTSEVDSTVGSCIPHPELLMKHNVSISMKQSLQLSSDKESLLRIRSMAQCFTQETVDDIVAKEASESTHSFLVSDDTTETDFEIIDGLMKQYEVARLLAERKEIRGGILVPCIDPSSPDRLTFDTFFDANEFSASKYSSLLKESLCLGSETNKTSPDDWVHASIQFHLDEGSVKVSFSMDTAQEEYVLLSFSGLDVEADFMRDQKEYRLRIHQFDIEDAHTVESDASLSRKDISISPLLHFNPHATGLRNSSRMGTDNIPCIDVKMKAWHKSSLTDQIEIEAFLTTIDTSLRVPTVVRCQGLLNDLLETKRGSPDVSASESIILSEELQNTNPLQFYVKMEGINVTVPLPDDKNHWIALYQRCGYDIDTAMMSGPVLGLTMDQLIVEGTIGNLELDDETTITLRRAIVFASSTVRQNAFDVQDRRTDICSFCGRAEVEPCIPLSVRIVSPSNNKAEHQSVSRIFPKVVDISSFKARQTEDNETDAFSENPEDEMVKVASTSRCAVFVFVPEFMLDIDMDEVKMIQEMVNSLASCYKEIVDRVRASSNQCLPKSDLPCTARPVSILVDFDVVSTLLRGHKEDESFCVSFSADRLKCHVSLLSGWLLQSRLILQNFTLCEGSITRRAPESSLIRNQSLVSAESRQLMIRQRMSTSAGIVLKPLLYRSYLFEPISNQSPSLLIDFVNDFPDKDVLLMGRKFYATVYDATYRMDFDSTWLNKLKLMAEEAFGESRNMHPSGEEPSEEKVLTRTFLSFVDVNIDYQSSPRFPTASRSILRVGDFRIASNFVAPIQDVQVVKYSLGDVSAFLCNERFPYAYENDRLRQSFVQIEDNQSSLLLLGLSETSNAQTVFQRMNNKTVATIDTLEGAVTLNRMDSTKPPLMVDVRVGEICIFVCKDSFTCLLGTLSEIATEITAVTTNDLDGLRSMSTATESANDDKDVGSRLPKYDALANLRERSALRPAFGCPVVDQNINQSGFLLDGYDWTTIDSDESALSPAIPNDEEQSARWYTNNTNEKGDETIITSDIREDFIFNPKIIADHFTLTSAGKSIEDGDMGIAKIVGCSTKAKIDKRVLIHDMALRLRLFDGYDWPQSVHGSDAFSATLKRDFIIPEVSNEDSDPMPGEEQKPDKDPKAELLKGLLTKEIDETSTFRNAPLPEERAVQIKQNAQLQQLARRTNNYLQFYAGGVSARMDSLEQNSEHRLASCLKLSIRDFFLSETISSKRPVKMIGEWFNEDEHPRDSNEGLLTMKIITWHSEIRVNLANEVASDECEAILQFLPLRCLLDQRAIAFARAFFNDDNPKPKQKLIKGLHQVPPPLYKIFRVLPLKLKVDYWPQKLNPKALRDGAIVELINISPLDGMVLTLKQVEITNQVGIGAAVSILVGRWVKDICSTQLLQFVTKARPLEPFTQLSGAATDMIVLPWEAFQHGESIQKALRSGVKGLSKTIAYELLTISSKTAQFLAGNASRLSIPPSAAGDYLPSRPMNVPRGFLETAPHAFESLNRGFQAANHRIVIVPYREYHRNGTTGAMKSVIRGIPVALAAPASGAAEALSFALIGVRNQVRPDIRREEEASAKGL